MGGQQKTMRENQGKMVTSNNPFQILEEKGEDIEEERNKVKEPEKKIVSKGTKLGCEKEKED